MALDGAAFLRRQGQSLCLDQSYWNRDMSERSGTTYWFGLAFAKVVADTELSIPWLCHVDLLWKRGVVKLSPGTRQRGDLVGRSTSGEWHVIEAKGRSSREYPQGQAVAEGKRQAREVVEVNGMTPATSSVCVSSLHDTPISVLLVDPFPVDDKQELKWRWEERGFLQAYYAGIISYVRTQAIESPRKVGGYLMASVPLAPFVSPLQDIYKAQLAGVDVSHLRLAIVRDILERPESAPEILQGKGESYETIIGTDGIALFGEIPPWEGA
jgi:hypothetical protein